MSGPTHKASLSESIQRFLKETRQGALTQADREFFERFRDSDQKEKPVEDMFKRWQELAGVRVESTKG